MKSIKIQTEKRLDPTLRIKKYNSQNEIEELKQKESEYNFLHLQILELEKKFQNLQSIKDNQSLESKENIENMKKNCYSIKKELLGIKNNLEELNQLNQNVNIQSKFLTSSLGSKEREISNIRSNIEFSSQIQNDLVIENKSLVEQESLLNQNNISLKSYIETQKKVNEENLIFEKLDDSKISSLKEEYSKMLGNNNGLKLEIEKLSLDKEKAITEYDAIKNERMLIQKEIGETSIQNSSLIEEKKILEEKEKAFENQLKNLEFKISEAEGIINSRIFDIEDLIHNLQEIQTQNIQKKEEIVFISKVNENLRINETKLIRDLEQKNVQNISEQNSIVDLELIKENLFNNVSQKEKEIENRKNEIKKLQSLYDHFQDAKLALSKEIDAVENHTRILEKQNIDVI